jgi:hypothetical protein
MSERRGNHVSPTDPLLQLRRAAAAHVGVRLDCRQNRGVSSWDRIRRWWKPAAWADDHPLNHEEREAREGTDFSAERAKLGSYTASGGPIDPTRDLSPPRR